MKTIFKILCALFLINSAYLNAAQYDPWQSTTWASVWDRYLQGNAQNGEYEDATASGETNDDYNDTLPTDQNTVEIEEEEPTCYVCADDCTQEEPYYARLRDYTCRHQILHKPCNSDTPCDDENCCAHAMMKQWHIQGDQVLCPFKCAASKTNNYRDLLKKLKKPSYLEKQRELAQITKKEQEKTVTSQPIKPSMNINNNPVLNDQEEQDLAEIKRQIEEQETAELNAEIAEFEANEQRQKAADIKRLEELARQEKIEQEKEADLERRRLEKLRVLTSQYDEENDDATEIYRRIEKLEEIKQKQKAADIKKQAELARIAKEEQEKTASTSRRKVGPPIAPKPTHNTTSRVNMSMPIASSSITVPSRFIHDQEEDDVEELLPTASSSNQDQNQDQSLNLGIFASHFDASNKNDYFLNNTDLNMLLLSFGSADAIMAAIGNITENNKDFANVLIRSLITLTSCYKTNQNPTTAQLITTLISHPHTQNIQKQDCPAGSLSKLAAQAPTQTNQEDLHNTIKNFTKARK